MTQEDNVRGRHNVSALARVSSRKISRCPFCRGVICYERGRCVVVPWGGGGIAINELFRVCATVKGMVFKQFNLG